MHCYSSGATKGKGSWRHRPRSLHLCKHTNKTPDNLRWSPFLPLAAHTLFMTLLYANSCVIAIEMLVFISLTTLFPLFLIIVAVWTVGTAQKCIWSRSKLPHPNSRYIFLLLCFEREPGEILIFSKSNFVIPFDYSRNTRRSPCRSNCTWPFGWCRGDLISPPDCGYYRIFYKLFLVGNVYVLAGVLKSQDFKLCFGAKSFVLGQKLAKLCREDRWSQPAPTVGSMQVSVHREVSIFFGTWPNLFWFWQCDGQTWKKKNEQRKETLWPKAKGNYFFNFSKGFGFGEGNQRLFTPGVKNFSCSRRHCSCLVRFALWGIGRPTISVFILEELGYEEPANEARRALAWPFFQFENSLSVKVIEEERKASDRQPSSDRWIEERRKKSLWVALEYTGT